jgi:NADPH:quinone reductase-like Zn-dependent oxidoreductase
VKAVAYKKPLPIADGQSLQDTELPEPVPGPRDLLVEVKAISVNPVDTKIRSNSQPPEGHRGILGWDAVGTIRAVGDKVTLFNKGDRVWYAGAINRPCANAELHVVDERIAALAPTTQSDAHAAALSLTGITAWEMLFDRLGVERGEASQGKSLLIIGAAVPYCAACIAAVRRHT